MADPLYTTASNAHVRRCTGVPHPGPPQVVEGAVISSSKGVRFRDQSGAVWYIQMVHGMR